MFEWNTRYSVQIESVDAQHRNLFRIAGELHAAMMAGQGKPALARILDRLLEYTTVHFAHEERLLRLHKYPDLPAHQAEHQALIQRVVQFQTDYQAGRVAMTVHILQFLKDWLEHHIAGSDQKYAPHLRAKAVA